MTAVLAAPRPGACCDDDVDIDMRAAHPAPLRPMRHTPVQRDVASWPPAYSWRATRAAALEAAARGPPHTRRKVAFFSF